MFTSIWKTGTAAMLAWGTLLPAVMGQDPRQEIRLTLSNELPFERRLEPVRCGVPLAADFAADPDDLALVDSAGRAVPVQIQATSRYPDGAPRWVLLDFQANVPAQAQVAYRLRRGTSAPVVRALRFQLADDVADIDTGVARFRISAASPRLFDSVTVGGVELVARGGEPGFLLEQETATGTRLDWRATDVAWEDAGPSTGVLVIRTALGPAARPVARCVWRLQFYAGKSEVRVFHTLHNPAAQQHPGNLWDLGSGGSLFLEDVSLQVPLAFAPQSSRVGLTVEEPSVSATRLYQDSSGGPHWNSVNHINQDYQVPVRFRGYRAHAGERLVSAGNRADGWIHVRNPAGGVAAAVRDFWQNFPKTLAVRDNVLRVGLWPREYADVHEILGGEQKTHELLFVFHAADGDDQATERRMQAFHRPLVALPDPQVLLASRAFWPTARLDRGRFGQLERTCDTFVEPLGDRGESVITKWDQIDEFGWRHFGDTFADNEFAPPEMVNDFPAHHFGRQPISHFGNEYDVSYAVLLQGLRRQDPRWMRLGDALCRHYADICVYHTDEEGSEAYRHGPFTHTTHDTAAFRSTHRMYPRETEQYGLRYASGGPNAGHCYVASLAQHYYLTGNRTSREAFLEVAEWSVESPWFTRMMMGDKRGIGNFLMTHVYAFQLTGDRKYYEAAVRMIDFVQEPFEGLGATLFVKAAGRFLDMKIERGERDADYRQALEKMLLFGDLYLTLPDDVPGNSLEQTCFYSELLCTCFLHAPPDHPRRGQYFARGSALMDQAATRWPGEYRPTKTLVMCFANTGAYFRALTLR